MNGGIDMNTAAQLSGMTSELKMIDIDALIEEACQSHDAAAEAFLAKRYDEAKRMFRRAIALFEQTEGADHPDVAAAIGNLGSVYEEECDYPEAEKCYERAVVIATQTEADDDDDV